ncbi:M28 family peptidase [Mucilaginibacter myungsuensis]|uniref:M28 family peptidase n=1 Tax=Mucilaginibacter myungsuensis TaxID=649104 RepID=A0A929L1S5_9SPHI|nr:M28 family peptidase [Mucilaginibacter myungsuensis]MBE9664558.1 M28 family peptidase [Mucilaginibacter myungsuensis]MDN3601092.1 M28 family peptidase [Mucilaginibacter myungsuensis]
MKLRLMTAGAACALVLGLTNAHAQTKKYGEGVDQAMQAASGDDMKAAITYLADDKLLGRAPGSPGFQMAADFVIDKLKSYGVQPAGENGGWTQAVRLRRTFAGKAGSASLIVNGKADSLKYNTDIFIYPDPVHKDVSSSGELAFVGYGITDKQMGRDDYAGMNVKGKIVVIVRGAPTSFPSSNASHNMDFNTIQKNAAAHGAIGVILATGDSTARGTLANPGRRGTYSIMDDKGQPVVSRTYFGGVQMLAAVGYKTLRTLASAAGKDASQLLPSLKEGKIVSFPTTSKISAAADFNYVDVAGFNIVGKIEGSDKKLKNEYVVHSAHLDHLGVGTPVQGDSIYNGAHDNASGVSSLLQIAKVYHNLKVKPKRSIIIVAVTGEELGTLGSGYFASHPTIPVKSMVADVNTDMPTIIAPLLSVTALGAEHSSLAKVVDEASAYMGLTVEADPEPEQNRFVRSDQYSFVVQGIPALHIKYGARTPDGKNNLNDLVKVWREKYYHKPQDDINGMFDFDAGRKYAQLNFLIGYIIANTTERPTWNKGDIFEKN